MEDIRVLEYERLRTMAMLVLVTTYFTSLYLGKRARLFVLVQQTERARKRIHGVRECGFYVITDRIKQLVFSHSSGIGPPRREPRLNLLLVFS